MNDYGEGKPCCYFHPREVIVGICALCLKERLLILASKQGHLPLKEGHKSFTVLRRKPNITLPKVFALGSLLHLLEFRSQRSDGEGFDKDSIASLEDSFISIKFEDDGRSSWVNKREASLKPCLEPTKGASTFNLQAPENGKGGRTSVVEHAKPRSALRWRKKLNHLLQLARWKRSNKAGSCHVGLAGKVEGVKGRRGWIRSFTRRRTTVTTTDQ